MPKQLDPNAELIELLDEPTCPFWVQNLVPVILKKDPVDVSHALCHLAEVAERRAIAILALAQSFPDGQRHEPWTLDEEREHERIYGVATMADSVREYASNAGEDSPDRPWILSPMDTWEKNPHYSGPPVRHPEDPTEEEEDSLRGYSNQEAYDHENPAPLWNPMDSER